MKGIKFALQFAGVSLYTSLWWMACLGWARAPAGISFFWFPLWLSTAALIIVAFIWLHVHWDDD